MSDLLSRFDGGQMIGLVAVGGGVLCALVAILGGYWYQGRQTALKMEMVNRGMTAEEIQVVMAAGSDASNKAMSRQRSSCRG